MLDEIKEYEQYKNLLESKVLDRKSLANGLNGLPRVYEILARHAMLAHHAMYDNAGNLLDKWKDAAKNEIIDWIRNDLKPYAQSKTDKSSQTVLKQLEDTTITYTDNKNNEENQPKSLIEAKLEYNMFTQTVGTYGDRSSDNNSVCFDSILADALEKGPLKVQYLIDKKDFINKLKFKKLNKNGKETKIKKNDIELDKNMDCIYKITADFLLSNYNNQATVYVKLVDILNWGSFAGEEDYLGPKVHYFYCDADTPEEKVEIYERICLFNSSVKIKLDSDWRKNFELISKEELTEDKFNSLIEEKAAIYKDQGHKLPLIRIESFESINGSQAPVN